MNNLKAIVIGAGMGGLGSAIAHQHCDRHGENQGRDRKTNQLESRVHSKIFH